MQRPNWFLIAGAALAAFVGGVIIGRGMPERTGVDSLESDQALIAPQERERVRDAEAQPRRAFQQPRAEDAPRAAPETIEGFQYTRLILDTENAAPRACLQFSEALDATGAVNYGDYIRLTPASKPAIETAGSSLCLTGLEFDKDYSVQLRPGLPSAEGATLPRGDRVAIAFGDKPAFIGFAGDGVILPRLEADGLGIETVNVEKLEVTVFRVSDRSLARKSIVKGQALTENDYYYVYGAEDGEDVGAPIYQGEIAIDAERNETETTVFALGAALETLKPGAYFVRAKDVSPGADDRRLAQAWRWIVFTDMALTTYSGADGVDVFVRSISSARPVAGVELSLIAANNDLLATVTTSAEGRARFEGPIINGAYPLTPRMIMAYGPQDDFAAIDLQRAPLDLSDRNIGGRAAPARLDAFVYLDRGIYRPGETVRLSGLLRNSAGVAAADRPLTVTIRRPNTTEAAKRRIDQLSVGGFSFDYDVPRSAPRGVWRISVEAEGAGIVGSSSFSVEDFVPQRLEVALDMDEDAPITAGEERPVSLNARFLYGAPAGGLAVETEARLRLDPNPFPAYREYRFGKIEQPFRERIIQLPNVMTDGAGAASFPLSIENMPEKLGVPLRADLVVGVVEPGGRVVRESARIPVRPDDAYLGLRLASAGSGVGEGEPAEIDAVLLNRAGELIDGALEWRLVEEDYWFDWYRENGRWRWRRSYKDVLIAEGRANAAASPARISQSLDPGSYRLIATDPNSGAVTGLRFYVGWRSYAAGADTPDQAAFTTPEAPLAPGARARLFLDAPYEGEAIITVATDRVHRVQRVKVAPEGREVIIDTDASWGSGFYVMATIVTPRDPAARPIPRRAMAVAYVPFDMNEKTFEVSLSAPETTAPRQQVNVPVTIEGAQAGDAVMLTLAAVDEGILRLTKFASPDPVDYFYGKKRLGVSVRDDYGRMLNANLGAPARFGGDQIGGEGLTVVPTQSVALFSGLVAVGANGETSVPVTLPDFNGELRLMAVAWSAEKLGAAATAMTVRDPVPALLALPRFLAPGDQATATLSIDNVDGEAGAYRVSLNGDGPVEIDAEQTVELAAGERKSAVFPVRAGENGIASIAMRVDGPGGFSVSRDYSIEVRTPFFPVANVSTAALDPGETFVATSALLDPFAPGSGAVNVSFSRLRGVEPGPLLDALYRYPYGCSEQLTSSATPLLFVDVLGGEAGRNPERAVRPRVQKAVNTLLDRQGPDGAFGLWREGDGAATPWLGAYVTDFLFRAKQEGYAVPEDAVERAYDALQNIASPDRYLAVRYRARAYTGNWSNDTTERLRRRAAAYALYVLARAGRADLSDLRYFHDALLAETPSPLARAHIAAALAMMGDNARAESAFEKSEAALGYDNRGDYYQTPLRDVAGVLALAAEAGRSQFVERVSTVFSERMREPDRLHTQEKAFVLLAAQALLRAAGPLTISVDGERIEGFPSPQFTPGAQSLSGDGVSYANLSEGPIFRTVTVTGAPIAPPPPAASGFTITKRIASRDGRSVDLSTVKQNDRLVVVISGRATSDRVHPAIIADLLPPGFEIDSILRPRDGAESGVEGPYRWVGALSRTKVSEARDDRFVAALDVRNEQFTVAYVVRAVTPGEYLVPGVVVEDMYRPGVVGRTAAERVAISPAG